MAAGSKITRDGQAELRGLLLGAGTPYPVAEWDGLSVPAIVSADVALEGRDGAAGGFDTYAHRQITGRIGVSARNRWELGERRTALGAAFARTDGVETVPFVVRLAYWRRLFWVRPRKLDLPWTGVDSSMAMHLAGAFALVALDPYAYDVDETTVPVELAGIDTDDVEIVNAGDGRTLPVLTFTGTWDTPVVANAATGRTITLDVVLADGDELVYDVAANTMTLNGVGGWWATAASADLELSPGAQTLTVSRTGTAGVADLAIAYRSAWTAL